MTKRSCEDTNMTFPAKELELQFEILILKRNIEKFDKLGMDTAILSSRLKRCITQLDELHRLQ